MLELWKKQFTVKRFYVKHDNPEVFISSQWQRDPYPNVYYLFYRWLMTTFFVISLVFSIIDLPNLDQPASVRAKWLIYLTSWGFAICTFQTLLGAIMLTSEFLKNRDEDSYSIDTSSCNNMLKLYKIYWIANITATDIALGITIIYWSFVYDEKKMVLDEMNVIVHIFNSIMMLIDLCIVAHPVNILHFYWPVLFGVCYVFFSIIYYLCGGTTKEGAVYIYGILNWSKPGPTSLVCVLVTVFILFLHTLVYGAYYLRVNIHARLTKIKDKENTKKEPNEKEAYCNSVISDDLV